MPLCDKVLSLRCAGPWTEAQRFLLWPAALNYRCQEPGNNPAETNEMLSQTVDLRGP